MFDGIEFYFKKNKELILQKKGKKKTIKKKTNAIKKIINLQNQQPIHTKKNKNGKIRYFCVCVCVLPFGVLHGTIETLIPFRCPHLFFLVIVFFFLQILKTGGPTERTTRKFKKVSRAVYNHRGNKIHYHIFFESHFF